MHVLIIPSERYITPWEPVSGIFQREQARALHRAGVKIGVTAPAPISLKLFRHWRALSQFAKQNVEEDTFPVLRTTAKCWLPGRTPYYACWLFCKTGKKLFRDYVNQYGRPDLLHVHNSLSAGVLAVRLKKAYGIPYVITEHSSIYFRGGMNRRQRRLTEKVFNTADYCLTVSKALGNALTNLLGNIANSWEVLPNILDPLFETCQIVKKPSSAKEFIILSIGGLNEVKNHSGLLRAFAQAFSHDESVYLRIGGDGPLRNDLERLARDLRIQDRVAFLGMLTREGVLREMQNCDVFVLPSLYETFGVVLIEAFACGRPVIATAAGGPVEIVNEKNGVLAPPGDVSALTEALLRMKKEAGQYHGEEIRRDCIAKYGERTIVNRLVEIYESVLQRSRK